jgi:hypothetical protein
VEGASGSEVPYTLTGQSFGGSWRPNPGADETINVPYNIGGRGLG